MTLSAIAVGFVALYIGILLVVLVYCAAAYVLDALGLFGVGKGLGVKAPWLAWIPYANIWNLGRLADKANELINGKKTNYVKWVLIMAGVSVASSLLSLPFSLLSSFSAMMESETLIILLTLLLLAVSVLEMAISVAFLVVLYICYYRVFDLCCPDKAVLFLILSIFFSFLLPFFVFYCRNKVPTFEYVQEEYEQETSEAVPEVE